MCIGIATHQFSAFASWLSLGAREKGGDTVGEPASRQIRTVEVRRCAVVGGVLDECEDGDNGGANRAQSPPEDIIPWLLVSDESAQCSATDNCEDDEDLEDGKGFAPLVQEEHVDDIASSQDGGYDTEQAGNES